MAKGGDFSFVGQSYQAPAIYQDAEECVNWYVEFDKNKGAKTPTALLGCPGLDLAVVAGVGPMRGVWGLPGGTQAIWASGSAVYLMTVATPATSSSFPTYKVKRVGSLATNSGPVVIRDGGASGFTWLVDGKNGYLYNNSLQTLAQITDPGFLGANRVCFIDGWMVFNQPGTQIFYTNFPQYGTLPFNASYFALKDGATDNLVTLYENKEELWLPGEDTTEIWYDAGGQYFPFQRLVSTMIQVGCAAPHSIARFATEGQEGLIWLGKSERGQSVVVRTQGFSAVTVSTPAISDLIATFPIVSDAVGYVYQEDGHEFYMLSFPSADITVCYDGTTDSWHKRLSYDPIGGRFHRHRSNCHVLFQGQHLVGDFQNGNIYVMSRKVFTDNGQPLVAWRRSPHVWDGGSRRRLRYRELQLDFRMGVGLPTGQGSVPRVALKWSDDSGEHYGNDRLLDIGSIGDRTTRCVTRRLGCSELGHSRVFDVRVSDPVGRDVVGATLIAGTGA